MEQLLEVKNLAVSFTSYLGEVQAVRGVTFAINQGETVAIVGESGCGKSVTAQTIMRLIPDPPGKIVSGEIQFNGRNLLTCSLKEMQAIRGREIGMIFQDPMTSLNPTMRISTQMIEGLKKHQGLSNNKAYETAVEMLTVVGIPQPEQRINQYPHEFSGGMRQRVMIAIALACDPVLLIADEPTTALDVTIQAQILKLLKDLQHKRKMGIILITHDLGIVAGMCDRVIVMYAGKIIEQGGVDQVFYNPQHPYTKALLRAIPRLGMQKGIQLKPIAGTPPNLLNPPLGCSFCSRCEFAMKVCVDHDPLLNQHQEKHFAACWLQHSFSKNL